MDKNNINDITYWFAMRVPYGREMKLKKQLDIDGVESYVPMCCVRKVVDGIRCETFVPAIKNLIFIKTTHPKIAVLKESFESTLPMRYIKDYATGKPVVVPDKQMSDFILVASNPSNIFLDMDKQPLKVGERVKVIDGMFKGIEGEVFRVKRNKSIVVKIDGVAAVAVAYIPRAYWQKIDE